MFGVKDWIFSRANSDKQKERAEVAWGSISKWFSGYNYLERLEAGEFNEWTRIEIKPW